MNDSTRQHATSTHTRSEASNGDNVRRGVVTIPNFLSAIRFCGAGGLIALALAEQPRAFLVLYLVLGLTDWLDGKLAVWLNQRSKWGPRLDSVADVTMYASLVFGSTWLKWDVLRPELVWIIVAASSYGLSVVIGFAKFHRLPSYHTLTAKACWFFLIVAVIALFMEWSIVPLRFVAVLVTLANLEAVVITGVLSEPRTDVTSLVHLLRRLRQSRE